MGVIGILTCEILELELAHLLASDIEVNRIFVLESERSARLVERLESLSKPDLKLISEIDEFRPDPDARLEVLVQVLEIGLHNFKKKIQEALVAAACQMSPYVDVLLLGYGLCGNALEDPEALFADTGVPVFIPMDKDHPVDDCIGLLIGGRGQYYRELCNVAGTFFMIPGWAYHWKGMFSAEFGNMSVEMAKTLFAHYERTLLISTGVMSEAEMRKNADEFSQLFGFRIEGRKGTAKILNDTWKKAKDALQEKDHEKKYLHPTY